MAKLKEFLTSLAKKAGYDTESEAAKPFFDALPDVDVPEETHKGIDNSLISLTEAKNNHPELKNFYTKQALDGVDKVISDLMSDFQVDEETAREILAEKSTYKRGPLLTRKLVELERKKAAMSGGKDKQEVQKQIDDLHKELKAEKDARESEKQKFENERLQDRINVKKNVLFGGLKTIHDELDSEIRYSILDTLVQRELQDKQAKMTFDDNGTLVLLRNDGTNYFGENHQQVKPAQFIEQVLAKNKQLKVTPTNGSGNGAQHSSNGSQQPAASGNGNGNDNKQSRVIDLNKQAMEEFNSAMNAGAH